MDEELQVQSFESPDETITFDNGQAESVQRPQAYSTRIDRGRRNLLRVITAGAALPAFAGVGAAKQVRTVVDFDPPLLPENLAIDSDGNVFMSMALTREVRKLGEEKTAETGLDKDDTELVTTLGADGTFVIGIAVDDDGTLYAVNTNFDQGSESIIWSVDPDGTSSQLVSLPGDAFPNGILIDADRDRLLVSDSFRGAVWAIPLDGSASGATIWVDDSSLDPSADPWANPGTVFGANGVAISEDVLHVANLDFGRIIRIPIESDGGAGTPTVFVEDDSLVGADGITFHNRSTLYVAVNAQNAIRRITGGGKIKTVISGGLLDYPADVAFDTYGRGRLFVANFAFGTFQSDPTAANPALLWTHP